MISFSIRLKEILKDRGMTQTELAEKAHTTTATISRYLNNNRTPNIELLNNITIALNVATDYLLGKTDDPTPPGKKESAPELYPGQNQDILRLQEIYKELDEEDLKTLIKYADFLNSQP